jgi:predicted dehydrogenase
MSHTYGIAIIGCGMMGTAHAKQWDARNDARIAATYDPIAERATSLAQTHNATACDSWQHAIGFDGVDVVSVCTPVCFHAEIAIQAAKAGRHVLCEKPIALSLADAAEMGRAAQHTGVQLSISYQYRGRARYRRLRELLSAGTLSGPVLARFVDCREVRPKTAMHRRSENGGPVIDMAGHYFDLMHYITGAEPVSVFASGHVLGGERPTLADFDDLAVDAAEIQVSYAGGHVLSVLVHWALPEGTPPYTNEFIMTADQTVTPSSEGITINSGDLGTVHRLAGDPPEPAVTIAALIDAIEGNAAHMVTVQDGQRALGVSLAALESIRTGRVVLLDCAEDQTEQEQRM